MEPNNRDNGRLIRTILLIVGIPALILLVAWMLFSAAFQKKDEPYSKYLAYFQQGQVQSFTLDLNDGNLEMLLREKYRTDVNKDGVIDEKDLITYTIPEINLFWSNVNDLLIEANTDDNDANDIEYDVKPQQQLPWFINILPTLLVVVFVAVMFIMMRRSLSGLDGGRGAMSFGKARVKHTSDEKRKTTFEEVAGADEEKDE